MKESSTVPEYSVESPLERTNRFTLPLEDTASEYWDQVAAELRLLSKELDMQFVISGKILDSLHALVQSLEAQR